VEATKTWYRSRILEVTEGAGVLQSS
jgi:hypothetical protein